MGDARVMVIIVTHPDGTTHAARAVDVADARLRLAIALAADWLAS